LRKYKKKAGIGKNNKARFNLGGEEKISA